jgi:hypothetical protein
MDLTTRRRRAIGTVLALFLAVESVSAVAATAATRSVTHALPPDPPIGQVLAAEGAEAVAPPTAVARLVPSAARTIVPPDPERSEQVTTAAHKDGGTAAAGKPRSRPRAGTTSKPKPPSRSSAPAAGPASYKGSNHLWIPGLGISRGVSWFPCDRARPPDNYIYRWGCAGSNNVYLMGHASSVMRPLYQAYVAGRLRTGMKAWYADASGKVHKYVVTYWKVVRPSTDAASWAWASQPVSSMTLQTCVGQNSAYRLMVRLVEVRG